MSSNPASTEKRPGVVVAAFVLSLFGFVYLLPAIAGLILGLVGLRRTRPRGRGHGLAVAAICVSTVWLLLAALLIAAAIRQQISSSQPPTSTPASLAAVPTAKGVTTENQTPSSSPRPTVTPESTDSVRPSSESPSTGETTGELPATAQASVLATPFCPWALDVYKRYRGGFTFVGETNTGRLMAVQMLGMISAVLPPDVDPADPLLEPFFVVSEVLSDPTFVSTGVEGNYVQLDRAFADAALYCRSR